jgi:hypothetical protein
MSADRVSALLDDLGQRSGDEWFGVADQALEVSVTDHGSTEALIRACEVEGSSSATEIDSMRSAADELGSCWVEVRVSGRVDGQAEMLDLVRLLLAAGGYAIDDFTEGLWSLDEITHGRRAPDERFRA